MSEEMIRDERYNFLSDYAFFMYSGELDKITEEMKPRDEIEQKWVKCRIDGWRNDDKRREEFKKRETLFYKEAEELLRQYAPKEYWSDGYFRSDEFEALKGKIAKKISAEVNNIVENRIEPWYSEMVTCNHLSSPVIWQYEKIRLSEILKEEYNINWEYLYWIVPDEFVEKLSKIKEKYEMKNVRFP